MSAPEKNPTRQEEGGAPQKKISPPLKNHLPNANQISFRGYHNVLSLISQLPEDEQVGHMRNLCRTDLYFLLRYGMNRKDVEREWLYDRCVEVYNNPDNHLDLWAREHYKSTIITVAKTIQDIFRSHGEGAPDDKELTFGIFSHTRPIAKAFLSQIKREFENNPRFMEWFPDVLWERPSSEAPSWSLDNGIILKRKSNPKEATIEAYGLVDGQPTGKHFDVLLYDDIVTSKSVYTPAMIEKTTSELQLSYNLGADGGARRFIGTRYSFADTYRTLMELGTATPRIYSATDTGQLEGEPVLLKKETLRKKRRDMGDYIFACQMMQNPVAGAQQKFRPEWLQYHEPSSYRGEGNNYIIVDPAHSKKKGADYTVMMVVQARPDNKLYVMEMVRDRLNLTERCSKIVELHKKWKPMISGGVRYERYGAQADIEAIQNYMETIGYRFDIQEVGGNLAKEDRILRLVPYFQRGDLMLPYQMWYTDYEGNTHNLTKIFREHEYQAFPVSVHDDMLDCLARAVDPKIPLTYPRDNMMSVRSQYVQGSGGLQDMDAEDFFL